MSRITRKIQSKKKKLHCAVLSANKVHPRPVNNIFNIFIINISFSVLIISCYTELYIILGTANITKPQNLDNG